MTQDLAMPAAAPRQRPELPTLDLTVVDAFDLHPGLRRVVFTADGGLPDYKAGNDLVFMLPLPDGSLGRRHYTIRAADRDKGTLAVDFVMHADTPGPRFARNAKAGDRVQARGPRGRTFLRDTDSHLMIGDETALPAILHMIEALPAGSSARAIIEVPDAGWEEPLATGTDATVLWVHRRGPARPSGLLMQALGGSGLSLGQGTAYVLAETGTVRALRHHLQEQGASKEQLVCEGYWRPGREGGHDHI